MEFTDQLLAHLAQQQHPRPHPESYQLGYPKHEGRPRHVNVDGYMLWYCQHGCPRLADALVDVIESGGVRRFGVRAGSVIWPLVTHYRDAVINKPKVETLHEPAPGFWRILALLGGLTLVGGGLAMLAGVGK